jgi:Mg2+-importing ATPase
MEHPAPTAFWSIAAADLLRQCETTPQGLSDDQARQRLLRYGPNLLRPKRRGGALILFLSQFKSPLILILIFAAGLSFFLHDRSSALIILTIIFLSGLLGFWQERGAADAVRKLLAIVEIKAAVLRDGKPVEVAVERIVPGDVVVLNAGDVVPADALVLDAKDLFADEATLTGESFPVAKTPGVLAAETPLSERANTLFMGTHVVSGTATAVVVHTGASTEFGRVSQRLALRPPETEFERGVRRFGYLLMEVTLILVIAIFAINVFLHRHVLESFLFSLALAVGLTPQLLPAIISVNLAHGAARMAKRKVIVKRLASIEDFGSMNILCCDKTGTLTEGVVQLDAALGVNGKDSDKVLLFAYLNAHFETGLTNPIDEAIRARPGVDVSAYRKLDEVPYDFVRKRLSVLVTGNAAAPSHGSDQSDQSDQSDGSGAPDRAGAPSPQSHPHVPTSIMITKGALESVLEVCSAAELSEGKVVELAALRPQIEQTFEELSRSGFRTLGVAYRNLRGAPTISRADETDLIFLGLLAFLDPPKPGVAETVEDLKRLGISLKIITGDNPLVTATIMRRVGLSQGEIVTSAELAKMSDEALLASVNRVDVFAQLEPNQKERIILALRKMGNVVGYLGDGINDASALHAADVGVSVDRAADVAREAADIVLLEKELEVLADGVREGRTTFANTLKYVFMATSANFGNMFSVAGASLFLPWLPLLPTQILLTNLMTDFPEMTIATDNVDPELAQRPRRWDIKFIQRFMVVFGVLSSVFDYMTFAALLLLEAGRRQFRSGWFIESVVSATLVVLVIRSRRPFFRSMPGRHLLIATLAIMVITPILPFTSVGRVFGFRPLPVSFLLLLAAIVALYVIAAEIAKRYFYRARISGAA